MPRHSRIVADFGDGIRKVWHDLHDGGWAYESIQDCDPILDANKAAQNDDNPLRHGDFRMQARIPFIVMEKWRNELGVDYWNPDHQGAVDRLLADSDWRWLRVDGVKNHNVSYSGLTIGPESKVFEAPSMAGRVLGSDGAPMRGAH